MKTTISAEGMLSCAPASVQKGNLAHIMSALLPSRSNAIPSLPHDALLHALYGAIGDDAAWHGVVQTIAQAFDATVGMMVVKGQNQRDQAFYAAWNHPDAAARAYSDYWWRFDPFVRNGMRRGLFVSGMVVLGSELVPPQQYLRTAFHRRFMRTIPARHLLACVVSDGQTSDGVPPIHLSLFRPETMEDFSATDKAWLAVLHPHIERAFMLHWRWRQLCDQVGLYQTGLDELDFGVLLIDPAMHIHYANPAARHFLAVAGTSPLGAAQVALPPHTPLMRLLHACGAGHRSVLPMAIGEKHVLAMALPMPGATPGQSMMRPHLMLLLADQDSTPATLFGFLAQGFGLSHAEARLLPSLYHGQSANEIAQALGLKTSTVRSQLSSILAKTGCRRQQDLVRLLGCLPPVRNARRTSGHDHGGTRGAD